MNIWFLCMQNRKSGTVDSAITLFLCTNKILISGPAGTGKTTVVKEVCGAFVDDTKNIIISTNCATLQLPQDVSLIIFKRIIQKDIRSNCRCFETCQYHGQE